MYLTIFVSFFFNNIVQELPNGWNIISTCIMSFRIMVEYFLFIFFFLSSSRISTSFFFFFFELNMNIYRWGFLNPFQKDLRQLESHQLLGTNRYYASPPPLKNISKVFCGLQPITEMSYHEVQPLFKDLPF